MKQLSQKIKQKIFGNKIATRLKRTPSHKNATSVSDINMAQMLSSSAVKSRPAHLAEQYLLVQSPELCHETFENLVMFLKQRYYQAIDNDTFYSNGLFFEAGYLENQKRYCYLKKGGDEGLLFELSPRGWTMARAEKIGHQKTFMRNYGVTDQVNIFVANDKHTPPRLDSELFNSRLIPMTVYREKLAEYLGL